MSAMSQEHVEVVRRVLETPVRREISDADLESRFHPDVHLDFTVREVNPATYDGYAGVRRFLDDLFEIWDEWEIPQPFELHAAGGERVLSFHTLRGRGRASGVVVDMKVYNLYAVREGRVLHVRSFRNPSEARQAAGLPP